MQQDLFNTHQATTTNSPALDPTMQPVDQQVRLDALDPHTSFAVAAPAGSGKTGLLTQRVLTILARCDEPEEVLAITFTRKAAAEMQDRILHALWQAAEQPKPTDTHALRTWALAQQVLQRNTERNWNLLQSPQRLRVQTIDSLCRAITKQLPLASGLGAQPDTLESPEEAYRLAVRELFKALEQASPLQDDLAQLLRHLDNNFPAVENLLVGLLAKREQWLGVLMQARFEEARGYLEGVLHDLVTEQLIQVRNRLLLHASELCMIADNAAQNLVQAPEHKNRIHQLLGLDELPAATVEAMPQWLALGDLLLTRSGTYRSRLTAAEGFPAGKAFTEFKQQFNALVAALRDTQPEIEALLHGLQELPSTTYAEQQWQLLASLTHILPQLVAQLMLVFKQLAATDYTAITQAALLALGDEDTPSDIALQLDYRIRHILVDEFQDTASPQLELLKKLTQGWQAGDGRTLFIVGDGMQSCYGFRNANVGLFLDARHQGIGTVPLQALDLRVNFRSQSAIVEWINTTFAHAFPKHDDISRGAVKYSPSTAFKPALEHQAVNFFACTYTLDKSTSHQHDNSNTDGDSQNTTNNNHKQIARQQEAQKIVELITTAQAENPLGSIAVLVRSRSHLLHILPALAQANLSYQATEIDSLASRMAIVDLLSLTRALLNPADRIAWLAILRAPWCGLRLADLHAIATFDVGSISPKTAEHNYPVIWQQLQYCKQITTLSPEAQTILARVLPPLQQAWQERYRKPLHQWIKGVWLALGGPATLLDNKDGKNIEHFFALLDKHEQGGCIDDWQAFHNAIRTLYAAPDAHANPRLQIMTIHKSKGLEFDTVIIPGLERQARNTDKQLLLWHERLNAHGHKQLLLSPLSATGEEDDPLYTFMGAETKKQQHLEATRLLYVGCTRAIKQLHLLACINTKDDNFTAPPQQSLLNSIWASVKESAQIVSPDIQGATAPNIHSAIAPNIFQNHTQRPGLQHILRLPAHWQAPTFNDVFLLKAYRGHEFNQHATNITTPTNPLNIPDSETTRARLARHTGTIIHSALQTIVENTLITDDLNRNDDLNCNDEHNTFAERFINQHQRFWKIQLQQLGWRDHNLHHAVLRISQAIRMTLASSQGRWLLNSTHSESACELALSQSNNQDVNESIIDRTFVADGTRWIVDYKSSEPEADETEAMFIERSVALHQAQLSRYKKLFLAIETLPVKTALYLISIGKLVDINEQP